MVNTERNQQPIINIATSSNIQRSQLGLFYTKKHVTYSLAFHNRITEHIDIEFSTQEKNNTQVPIASTSSIDYEGGAINDVPKRKTTIIQKKQLACPIAIDCNSLFDIEK